MYQNESRQDAAMRALGRYVAARREALGISQEELADEIGVSQGFVSNLERGKRTNIPTIDELDALDALSRALHCTPDDLLAAAGFRGNREPAPIELEDDEAIYTSLMRGVNRLGISDNDKRAIQLTIDLVRRASDMQARDEREDTDA